MTAFRASLIASLVALVPATGFAQQQKLVTTNFIVLGEGLAAGMADFSLRDVYQKQSFPALIAGQLNTAFPQPLIEPPGIGSAPGFPAVSVTLPNRGQSTVREIFPPQLFVFNLSVPGLKLTDALNAAPVRPMIQKNNSQQTVINMILGYPAITLKSSVPLWTQVQYAVAMNPSLVLVELGYYDVLAAAVAGDPTQLPDPGTFQSNYSKVLSQVGSSYPTIIVTTVPNPMDTAYFTSLSAATSIVGAPASVLMNLYGLQSTDLITVPGLMTISNQILSGKIGVLPAGSVVSASVAAQVTANVTALNSAINTVAQQNKALVYDLNAFFSQMKTQGLVVNGQQLTAGYLGGIYSLDGYYPGFTAHAMIANNILALLNKQFGTSYATVNVTTQSTNDPAIRIMPFVKRKKEAPVEVRR